MKKIAFVFFLSFALISCSEDSKSDLEETTMTENTDDNSNDESTENNGNDTKEEQQLSFAKDIQPTLNSRCLNCHGSPVRNGASRSLTTENQVKQNGSDILNRIQSGNMPRNSSKLSSSYINNFEAWLNQQ